MGLLTWIYVRYSNSVQVFLIFGTNFFFFFCLQALMKKVTPEVTTLCFSFHIVCVWRALCWQCWLGCCALFPGSDTTLLQGNGGIAPTLNGYTCSDCSMLSERKEVLTAYSASPVPPSRIYTRDRSQKHAASKLLSLVFHFYSVV